MSLSVIIPTLNEGNFIEGCLESIRASFSGEVIVVDAGSEDGTTAKAMNYSTRIFSTKSGLAEQCNEGAREAMGNILFFVSADSRLEKGWFEALERTMESTYVVGGGFQLSIDDPNPIYQLLSFGGNFRARYLKMALGDQGLFVRKNVFKRVGGFSKRSLIPHAYLCHRLKELGEFVLLPEVVESSAREWKKEGVWATTLKHLRLYLRFRYSELPHFA